MSRPDGSPSARRLEWLSRFRPEGTSFPNIADLHPGLEIRGENETIVLRLSPDHANELFAAVVQQADVPVLPTLPAE